MSYRKKYKEEFVWETSLFWLHTLLTISFFVVFFVYSLSQVTYFLNDPNKDTKYFYGWYRVWYGTYENLLQFNTSWLASLRTWYYFRLCFSFSCSGYDLTLIKKSHTRNCYLFSQKFLLKTKTYKLLLVTVVAQFTAKTANSEKAIYFLSLMSCSINKPKS